MPSVLVAREFDNFSRILSEANFAIINCPTVKSVTLEDLSDFEKRILTLESYDGIFLTSANATKIFCKKLLEKSIGYNGKVYVLGERSFDLLKDEQFDLFYDETANTARELLEKIASEDLKDKRFLYVRGEKSLRVIPDFLKTAALLDEAIVYRTEKITVNLDKINELREKFENGEIVCACFFSPSAAESFTEIFGAVNLHQTKIAVIGKTTAGFFERQGLTIDFVSPKATAEDFAVELINYLSEQN